MPKAWGIYFPQAQSTVPSSSKTKYFTAESSQLRLKITKFVA